MNKTVILLNLIISSISVVRPMDEITTNEKIEGMSEKIFESVSFRNFNEEDLFEIKKDDILITSEIIKDKDNSKNYYENKQYLKEAESVTDENLKVSSENNSVENSIITQEENRSQNLDSETRTATKDENYENSENKSSTITKQSSEIEIETDILEKEGGHEKKFENPVSHGDTASEIKSDITSKISEKKSAKMDYGFKKPNDESNSDWDVLDDLVTRRMNSVLNDSILYTNESSEERNSASSTEKNTIGLDENNVTSPKQNDVTRRHETENLKNIDEKGDKSLEGKMATGSEEIIATASEEKMATGSEEIIAATSEEKMATGSEEKITTRSEDKVDISTEVSVEHVFTSPNENDRKVERDEFLTSIPIPEYINTAKNSNGRAKIGHPGNIRLPHTHTATTSRERPHIPTVYNLQHSDPIDLNTISSYERNVLRNNRLIPVMRRNNVHPQDIEKKTEYQEPKVIDDFDSEPFSNAYPYTPLNPEKISQESVTSRRRNSLLLKLINASENSRHEVENASGENSNLYKGYLNNYRRNIVIPSTLGLYRYMNG